MAALAVPEGFARAAERFAPPLVVTDDYGGSLPERVQQIEAMRRKGISVAVPYGHCMSACTLYLGLPDTCVGPSAVFGFHGPSAGQSTIGLPQAEFEHWTRLMASYYPPPLRRWFLREGRYTTLTYKTVSGAELIRLGVRACT